MVAVFHQMCAQALEILISEFTVDIHGILIQTRRLDGRETWFQLNINSVWNALIRGVTTN